MLKHIFPHKIYVHKHLLFCLLLLIIITINGFIFLNKNNRDGIIVEVPINAFDSNGNFIDKRWETYLRKQKPVGIIFFSEHFKNREFGKKIIKIIRNTINDEVILSADEEGGRINRFHWLNIDSAEEIAEAYKTIKKRSGTNKAKAYVRNKYVPMFKEMKYLGLNTTFAPNLDLNKYASLDKNTEEYKNYKKCVQYTKFIRLNKNKIKPEEKNDYNNSLLFFAYLDEIGIRSLSVMNRIIDEKDVRNKWTKISIKKKKKLIKQFEKLKKYANYTNVIGDRSFGNDTEIVSEVAEIFVDTAKEFDINCVAKHALGHGRVDGDTHVGKQHSKASIDEILHDIEPYIYLKNKINLIMPSHIVYDSIDNKNTAINSKKVLDFIREKVKKDLLFITDDISMNGAEKNKKNPCDLSIVTHKPIDEVIKIGKKKKVNTKLIKKILIQK